MQSDPGFQLVVYVMTFSTQTWRIRNGEEWGQPEAFSYSVSSWSLRLQSCFSPASSRSSFEHPTLVLLIDRYIVDFLFYWNSERVLNNVVPHGECHIFIRFSFAIPFISLCVLLQFLRYGEHEETIFRVLRNSLEYYSRC